MNIFNSLEDIPNDRVCKSLTGLALDQFKALSTIFESSYRAVQERRIREGEIKRLPSGGKAKHFKTSDQKLFFILYYKKNYPTFDTLGYLFNLSSGHAHEQVMHLLPCLEHSLSELKMLPARCFETVDEMEHHIGNTGKVAIDGLERPCQRPGDDTLQKDRYSGKKNAIQSSTLS